MDETLLKFLQQKQWLYDETIDYGYVILEKSNTELVPMTTQSFREAGYSFKDLFSPVVHPDLETANMRIDLAFTLR